MRLAENFFFLGMGPVLSPMTSTGLLGVYDLTNSRSPCLNLPPHILNAPQFNKSYIRRSRLSVEAVSRRDTLTASASVLLATAGSPTGASNIHYQRSPIASACMNLRRPIEVSQYSGVCCSSLHHLRGHLCSRGRRSAEHSSWNL